MRFTEVVRQWKALENWQKGAAIGVVLGLWVIGTVVQGIEEREMQQQSQQAQIEKQQRAVEVPLIFDRINLATGYRPQTIQWGQGQALTIPKREFAALTMAEKKQIYGWMEDQYGRNYSIFLGRVTGQTMTLDEQIWP